MKNETEVETEIETESWRVPETEAETERGLRIMLPQSRYMEN